MKKLAAFIIVLSTVLLCGCDFFEPDFYYRLPAVETGVEAVLNDEIEQPVEVTDIIVNGEKYTDVYFENTGFDIKVRELATPIKAVANYAEHHTFYEFQSYSGVQVLADNINLQLFVRNSDEKAFLEYYHNFANYDYYCYRDDGKIVTSEIDVDYMVDVYTESEVNYDWTYDNDIEPKVFSQETVFIEENCEQYTIKAISKDWLIEYHQIVLICCQNGKYYYADDYYDNGYDCIAFSDEYQQYFKKVLA